MGYKGIKERGNRARNQGGQNGKDHQLPEQDRKKSHRYRQGPPVHLKVPASAEAAEIFAAWKAEDDANFARATAEEKEYCEHYAKVTKAMAE